MADEKIFDGLGEEENTSPETVQEEQQEEEQQEDPKPAAKSGGRKTGGRTRKAAPAKAEEDHVIRLHDSSEFPPGGLTVGINGKFYRLRPDVDMEVPESVLEVLDHAVRTEGKRNEHGQIVGTRNVPRFPYTMVRRK